MVLFLAKNIFLAKNRTIKNLGDKFEFYHLRFRSYIGGGPICPPSKRIVKIPAQYSRVKLKLQIFAIILHC